MTKEVEIARCRIKLPGLLLPIFAYLPLSALGYVTSRHRDIETGLGLEMNMAGSTEM